MLPTNSCEVLKLSYGLVFKSISSNIDVTFKSYNTDISFGRFDPSSPSKNLSTI